MTSIKTVACIGAGYFSQFHYDAWSRISGARPVASVDLDLNLAKATGLSAYTDVAAMLERERPDIVDIITPPPGHLEAIAAVAGAGVKAIICQKPFCKSIAEAEEAIAIADRAGSVLVVHENIRFSPWNRKIKESIDAGLVGDVQQITFRLRPGDGQGPDAYLERQPYFQTMPRFLVHETAVHWVDTFRFFLGEPESIFADLRQLNPAIAGEDAGHILFYYPNGVRAMFDGNRLLDHAATNHRCTMGEALVEGTEGTISLAGDGSVTLRKFGELDQMELMGASTATTFGGDCVFHLQEHVVKALNGEGALENTAADYLRVLKAEELIYSSSEQGQRLAFSV